MFCTHTIGAMLCASIDLLRGDVADPEVANQTLLLELHESLEGLSERTRLRALSIAQAHVDQVEHLNPEGLTVLMDLLAQILRAPGRGPATLGVAVRPHLGHDVQRPGIGVQRLPDQLVGDARPVGVAGVDVGYPQVDSRTQHGQRTVMIGGRPHAP